MTDSEHSTKPLQALNAGGTGGGISEFPVIERDGEPRVLDLELANSLGLARPTNIRALIEANRTELEAFGSLHAARAEIRAGKGAKREGAAFLLTEEQALLVSTISKAPNAPAVRAMLIRTFVAWRRGHLAALMTTEVVDLIRRTDGIARMLSGKVTSMQARVEALEEKNAVPALDFGGTVTAHQMIEMAGIRSEDRQQGTAQMVTRCMISFCAERQVACFRTPAEVNPSRPFRFPIALASAWLLGDGFGVERIRNQVERMKAKKGSAVRGSRQMRMQLVASESRSAA